MKLYILRHGESVNADEDEKRVLTEKGIVDTEKIGNFIKSKNIEVDVIYHSVKKRAYQTASIISKYVNSKNGLEEADGLKPNDDIKEWIKKVEKIDKSIMIVGHLPFLNNFVSYLLGNKNNIIINIPASGLVCLEKNDDNWIINWMIIPELL